MCFSEATSFQAAGQEEKKSLPFPGFTPQNINFGEYFSHFKRVLYKLVHASDSS